MINFRYHLISLIAVFLALGIGVIMGTSVIDRAVVDRLERQQATLEGDVDEVRRENNRLRGELRAEREAARRLADEGSERLLDETLTGVPVLVIGAQGAPPDGLDALTSLLTGADADVRGVLWLTDRFTLDTDGEVRALGEALGFAEGASAGTLRSAALSRLARQLRPPRDGGAPAPTPDVLPALLASGFAQFDAPEGSGADVPELAPGTRIVLLSGPGIAVPDRLLTLPLLRGLVEDRPDRSPSLVLAAAAAPDEDSATGHIGVVRADRRLASRVSSVDHLGTFAGRLAAVLALADLGVGRVGHYGVGPGADRLLPAPAG